MVLAGLPDVVLGAEAHGGVEALRGLVHPRTLRPRERALLEVTRDDVLAELRADLLDEVPEATDYRVDAAHRVLCLCDVVDHEDREQHHEAEDGQSDDDREWHPCPTFRGRTLPLVSIFGT